MAPACFPSSSSSSSPSTCLWLAADTLQQSWPRITRFAFAALVPAAGLFLAYYAGQDAAFVHSHTYVSFMQWLLITTLVVSLPTVGKTAQKAIERALGSFLGGVLGLLFVASPTWCQMLGMVFAAALGDFVSVHFKKDYTGRLIPITFAIVVSGAVDALHPWLAAVMRMAAVLAGVLWTCTVSLIWFPETSSRVAFKQLVKMQQHLKSLGSNTWALMEQQQQQLQLLQQQSRGKQQPSAQDGSRRSGSTAAAADRLERTTGVAAASSDIQLAVACSSTEDKRQTAAGNDRETSNDARILVYSTDTTGSQHQGVSTQLPNTAAATECLRVERQLQQGVDSLDQTAVLVNNRPREVQDDLCDDDVRDFFAARAVLQDALSTAGAENPMLGWLCGLTPVIVTSSSSSCTPHKPGLYTCHCFKTRRAVGSFGSSAGLQAPPQPARCPQGTTVDSMAHNSTSPAMPPNIEEHVHMSRQQDTPPPHFLPRVIVTNVAVAQRHCSHVLWTLHKLMQNKFDPDSLLAINQRYPADMLQNIAQDCQAVLQAAMDCLQTAIQPSRPCRGRHSSSCQVPAILQGQLQKLHACSNSLHRHLERWQERFVKAQQLRRVAMAHVASSKAVAKGVAAATPAGAAATEQHAGELPASSSACVAAAVASDAVVGVGPALVMSPITPEQQAVEWCNAPVCGQLADLQAVLDALFITPTTRNAYIFVLQWHALHYILVQLDSAFAELTASLDELLLAMHGVQAVVLPLDG